MEMKNKVESAESVFVVNPMNAKNSLIKVKKKIETLDFTELGSAYPIKEMDKIEESVVSGKDFYPPKCTFLPTPGLLRAFIRATLKFSQTDSQERFLLRFGLVDDIHWYFRNEEEINKIKV